jgi:uncharacterized protein Usg
MTTGMAAMNRYIEMHEKKIEISYHSIKKTFHKLLISDLETTGNDI